MIRHLNLKGLPVGLSNFFVCVVTLKGFFFWVHQKQQGKLTDLSVTRIKIKTRIATETKPKAFSASIKHNRQK